MMMSKKLTTGQYYTQKIKPFLPDDTIEYKDLSFFTKIEMWLMARSYNKDN